MWSYLRINIKDIKWDQHFLQACNVIQGTNMAAWNWWISLITHIQGSDLTESFVPIISACPVSYSMAFSTSWNIIWVLLDYTNSFQNTIIAPADIFYVPMPPYYLQWLIWSYLQINIKDIKWGLHFLQACNVIQGTKPASLNWWISLDAVLTGFGLINLPCEQVVYVLDQDD